MHPSFVSIPLPHFLIDLLNELGLAPGPLFEIHTYGIMAALGFLMAILLVTREAKHKGQSAEVITNLLFGLILWGIIGSRLLFVAIEWSAYVDRPLAILNIREGGLVFQGGLIGALIFGWRFMKKHELPAWQTADVVILGLPLGHVFGRLGCFAAGCCYGKPTDLPWAVHFADPRAAMPTHFLNLGLHPVQLYGSFGNLLIFIGLYWVLRRHLSFDGQVALLYFILYPLFRIFVEFYRGDVVRGFFLESTLGQTVSTSQAISVIELIVATGLYIWRSKNMKCNLKDPDFKLDSEGESV